MVQTLTASWPGEGAKPVSSRISGNRIRWIALWMFAIGAVALASDLAFAQQSSQQSPLQAGQARSPNQAGGVREYWVGWMDSSERQLRWILQFNRAESADGPITSAATWNPDISATPIPLDRLEVKEQYWTLGWKSAGNEEIKYEAIQESDSRATGFLIVGDRTLAVPLNKVDTIPTETARDLGADIVWLDQLPPSAQNLNPKRFDLRMRFYTEGPFAIDGPRIVLDSIASKLTGVPVELDQTDDEYLHFQIPALNASYRALVSDDEKSMAGKFIRNQQESELELKLLPEDLPAPPSTNQEKPQALASNDPKASSAPTAMSEQKPAPEKNEEPVRESTDLPRDEGVTINIQGVKESSVQHDLAPNEKAFTLDTSPIASRNPSVSQPAPRLLGGTIAYSAPQATGSQAAGPSPAIILLSTYGPNDRDGTIGKNRFYKQLAAWFSEHGIASVRLDDRGVGESTPIQGMTSDDQLKDVIAVLHMLKNDPQIDPRRIGLFGHGEGADLAMRVAAVEPNVAFSLLYGPSGINGFELTKERLIASAIKQGMTQEDAQKLAEFQRRIQEIALRHGGDPGQQIQLVRELIASHWSTVGGLTNSNLDLNKPADRSAIEAGLMEQVAGFASPLARDALQEDPATFWMLGTAPTLAMFGDDDAVVSKDWNIEPLTSAALRSGQGRFEFVAIPHANHWFTSQVAKESDYDEKSLEIQPAILATIKGWLNRRL